MRKSAAAAAVLYGVALLGGCGKDPGEPSYPQAAGKSYVPETPTPPLIEPIPPNAGHGPPVVQPRSASGPLRVGGDVIAPVEISRVEPDCGQLHGSEHPAIVELIVTDTGLVRAGRVLRTGTPAAKSAILAAARQWRFRPAVIKGNPVEVFFTVTTRGCP